MNPSTTEGEREPLPPFDREIDLSGLTCPLPILRTKAAIATLAHGQTLKVTFTSLDSVRELTLLVQQTGYPILASYSREGAYVFFVRKTHPMRKEPTPASDSPT